jgi:hypothetical protein
MKIDQEAVVEEAIRPEWARIPGAAQRIGIRPSRFYELVRESNGAVRTFVLKSPGATRGARLVYLPSLFSYLDKMATEQEQEEKENA